MPRPLYFKLADHADDASIRRLLRENPMGGEIALSLEREPSYFDYSGVDGPFHQVIIGKEQDGDRLVAMASRSIRPYYFNGSIEQTGYLSQLRFAAPHRRFFPLQQGFRYLKELHGDQRTPFYLTSIMEDNIPASRVLVSGVRGLPCYREFCRFTTHTIPTRRRSSAKKLPDDIRAETGTPARIDELIDFLHDNNKMLQFAPVWDAQTLFHPMRTPGLSIYDFILAIENERIVGCMALWDQRLFKQAVIRSYSKNLTRWRFIINAVAALKGVPKLPAINSILPHCYLSHIAIRDLRNEVFSVLLHAALKKARQGKVPLLTVGFAAQHPLNTLLEEVYTTFKNLSRIFLVFWSDQDQPQPPVDDTLIPGLDVSIL